MDKARILGVLKSIQADCEQDAKDVDGMPFTGKTVGEFFGKTLAMISALAIIVESHITEDKVPD